MDQHFLNSLSKGHYSRLKWFASHGPKPLDISEIPQDKDSLAIWRSLKSFDKTRKVFPPYKKHLFAAKKFGLKPANKFKRGFSPCISSALLDNFPPNSIVVIYKLLYSMSYYNCAWRMRVCEVSYGLIKKHSTYSDQTIYRAMDFLRKRYFVRLIWRGRPDPEEDRYLHSCYELPLNFKHILSWRINKGRKRR